MSGCSWPAGAVARAPCASSCSTTVSLPCSVAQYKAGAPSIINEGTSAGTAVSRLRISATFRDRKVAIQGSSVEEVVMLCASESEVRLLDPLRSRPYVDCIVGRRRESGLECT